MFAVEGRGELLYKLCRFLSLPLRLPMQVVFPTKLLHELSFGLIEPKLLLICILRCWAAPCLRQCKLGKRLLIERRLENEPPSISTHWVGECAAGLYL